MFTGAFPKLLRCRPGQVDVAVVRCSLLPSADLPPPLPPFLLPPHLQYVSHNGGSFNACTSAEFTSFFFDVGCEHLRGVLDRSVYNSVCACDIFCAYRFSQFFISPLFNADARDREVNAVESGRYQLIICLCVSV